MPLKHIRKILSEKSKQRKMKSEIRAQKAVGKLLRKGARPTKIKEEIVQRGQRRAKNRYR